MLVGIGGHAGTGKDTVADFFVSELGFVSLGSFSVGLNECLLTVNPLVACNVRYAELFRDCGGYEGYAQFKEHAEVRRLLQAFGHDVGREMIDKNVWVDLKKREILAKQATGNKVVVTSIRYPNEIEMIKKLDGKTVWVSRPGFGPINSHASDNSLSRYDFEFEILNVRTLEDLRQATVNLYDTWRYV